MPPKNRVSWSTSLLKRKKPFPPKGQRLPSRKRQPLRKGKAPSRRKAQVLPCRRRSLLRIANKACFNAFPRPRGRVENQGCVRAIPSHLEKVLRFFDRSSA